MTDVDLANAIIAAALIQSGEFKLSEFDERAQPLRGVPSQHKSETKRLLELAATLSDPEFDAHGAPAFSALRTLTNAIRRSLHEPP